MVDYWLVLLVLTKGCRLRIQNLFGVLKHHLWVVRDFFMQIKGSRYGPIYSPFAFSRLAGRVLGIYTKRTGKD